jgi:hypothetical protein
MGFKDFARIYSHGSPSWVADLYVWLCRVVPWCTKDPDDTGCQSGRQRRHRECHGHVSAEMDIWLYNAFLWSPSYLSIIALQDLLARTATIEAGLPMHFAKTQSPILSF